jgi:hypothetical protein
VRVAALIAAAVLAAFGGAACGGDDDGAAGVPPEQWTGDVCGAMGSWIEDFLARAEDLQASAAGFRNLQQARNEIVEFLTFTVDRTDELLADIDRAGQPAVDDGAEIARALRQNLEPFRDALVDARARAEKLPVDDPARFEREATELGGSVERAGQDVGSAFEELEGDFDMSEIQEAAETEPECEDFQEALQ